MSSRNVLLDPGIRRNASVIFKTLTSAASMIKDHDIPEIRAFVEHSVSKFPDFKLEYFDIVDNTELNPVRKRDQMEKGKRYFGCIAVHAGKIRLIDNIDFGLV
jgi:pantoate--beta-alanine ligase